MADVAVTFGFGHGDMCRMDLEELGRWQARAHDLADSLKESRGK
ncbi:GpE family phage tail protein [Fluviibacterium sp. DFM31]|uniref:GpE family phage tail protein n=1 Tax=Meridianimarinicoccus marinus TaxID=3231483 RepID=A0ABV3L733_9RHOB